MGINIAIGRIVEIKPGEKDYDAESDNLYVERIKDPEAPLGSKIWPHENFSMPSATWLISEMEELGCKDMFYDGGNPKPLIEITPEFYSSFTAFAMTRPLTWKEGCFQGSTDFLRWMRWWVNYAFKNFEKPVIQFY